MPNLKSLSLRIASRWMEVSIASLLLASTGSYSVAEAQSRERASTATWPAAQEGDYIVKTFHFHDGSTLP